MTDDDLTKGDVMVVMARMLREASARLVAVDKLATLIDAGWPQLTDVAVMLADAAHALNPLTKEDQP
jgi:hypothetical protein